MSEPVGHPDRDAAAEAGPIEVVAERVVVETRVAAGDVVRVRLETEHVETTAAVDLARERVEVRRVSIGREVAEAPQIRVEGDVTIIPVLEEVVVVETRLRLVEEIHVRRIRTLDHVETPVTSRRQRAIVERAPPGGGTA